MTRQTVEIIIELHAFFNDLDKVTAWLNTPNLNFGGPSPVNLIYSGRGKRVLQFIQSRPLDSSMDEL